MKISSRFEEALLYAYRLHQNQVRKGTEIPYFAHLISVTALVLEDGGSEDEAIAALLHDAVEDQGGYETLSEIKCRFGHHVAEMVDQLSDAYTIPKPPWRKRKETYLTHLKNTSPEVLRISLADKLHNARTALAIYREIGDDIWERFKGGKSGSLWYYRALLDVFRQITSGYMLDEYELVVSELERLARDDN